MANLEAHSWREKNGEITKARLQKQDEASLIGTH